MGNYYDIPREKLQAYLKDNPFTEGGPGCHYFPRLKAGGFFPTF